MSAIHVGGQIKECPTFRSLSSEPETMTLDESSANATAFTSSSCDCTQVVVCRAAYSAQALPT